MTDLLKKEKVFLEMNEKLNKMTDPVKANVGSPRKARNMKISDYNRLMKGGPANGTFTKKQGLSTFLKKQGAGDFHSNGRSHSPPIPEVGGRQSPVKAAPGITSRKPSQPRDLIVRYKNPNYDQSPSFEIVVKEDFEEENENSAPALKGINPQKAFYKTPGFGGTFKDHKLNGERKKLTTEGMIKFLKSKVGILEEEHKVLNRELSKQKDTSEKTLEKNRLLEHQRDQAYIKNNSLTEQVHKLETQLEDVQVRLKEKVQIQLQNQKEIEDLRRELKMLSQSNANLEKRLFRANEDAEATRTSLAAMRNAERDYKDAARVDLETKDRALRSHKKMRNELLSAIRKQLYLIDNLGRQNACLEQAALLNLTEREFNKFLEMDPPSK